MRSKCGKRLLELKNVTCCRQRQVVRKTSHFSRLLPYGSDLVRVCAANCQGEKGGGKKEREKKDPFFQSETSSRPGAAHILVHFLDLPVISRRSRLRLDIYRYMDLGASIYWYILVHTHTLVYTAQIPANHGHAKAWGLKPDYTPHT